MSTVAAPTSRYKTDIFQVYTRYIPGIYLMKSISWVYSMSILGIFLSYTFKRYIHGIYYLVYTWHMTMYVVAPEYTSKKLNGFVLYQSRTLLDM